MSLSSDIAPAVPTTIEDPQSASELVDLFANVLALADRVDSNNSDSEADKLPYRGVLTLRQEVGAKLKQVGANVDRLPAPVRNELENLARIFQDMRTKCVTIPDVLAFIVGSDLRGPAWCGWRAVTAANPANQDLFPWAQTSISNNPSDLPEAIRASQRQAATAKEAKESLESEKKRRQPVLKAWDGLYVSRPYPYGEDSAAEVAWLVGWSQRLAGFGETVSAAGYRKNVEVLAGDDAKEQIAIELLKAALDGKSDRVLTLLQQCPPDSGWQLPFNYERLLGQILDPRCSRCGDSLDQDHRCSNCRRREGKMFEIAAAIECESKWGQPAPDKLAGSDVFKTIKHFACELFGSAVFDPKTLERLEDWMAAEHGKSSEEFLHARQSDVAGLLREACTRKPAPNYGSGQNQSDCDARTDLDAMDSAALKAEFETALRTVQGEVAQDEADLKEYFESMQPTPEQVAMSEAWQKRKQALEKALGERHAARLAQYGWKTGQFIPADDPNFDQRHVINEQAMMDQEAMNRVLGVVSAAGDEQSQRLQGKGEGPGGEGALVTSEPLVEIKPDIPIDLTAYVLAKAIVENYCEKVIGLNYKRLNRILDENPHIKRHKPTQQRLLVHLADFDDFVRRQQGQAVSFDNVDEFKDGVKARTTQLRERKQQQGESRPRGK